MLVLIFAARVFCRMMLPHTTFERLVEKFLFTENIRAMQKWQLLCMYISYYILPLPLTKPNVLSLHHRSSQSHLEKKMSYWFSPFFLSFFVVGVELCGFPWFCREVHCLKTPQTKLWFDDYIETATLPPVPSSWSGHSGCAVDVTGSPYSLNMRPALGRLLTPGTKLQGQVSLLLHCWAHLNKHKLTVHNFFLLKQSVNKKQDKKIKTCTNAGKHSHTHTRTQICMHIQAYAHTHAHSRRHTHIHTKNAHQLLFFHLVSFRQACTIM